MALFRDFANLVIDGPPAYERSVAEQLDRVWDTWTGWAVLLSVLEAGQPVRIVPPSAADRKRYARRADAPPARDGSPRDPRAGRGGAAGPATPEDNRFRLLRFLRGLGTLSGSGIRYSPDTAPVAPSRGGQSPPGYRPPVLAVHRGPDDALVYELVHALRRVEGRATHNLTLTEGYGDEEEYFAVLVQNTYASEKGVTVHRRGGPFGAEDSGLPETSETFLGKGQRRLSPEQLENRQLVSKFVSEHPALCQSLATQVETAFNPVGEFVRNRAEYPHDHYLPLVWSV
jgi:hypothetical protein